MRTETEKKQMKKLLVLCVILAISLVALAVIRQQGKTESPIEGKVLLHSPVKQVAVSISSLQKEMKTAITATNGKKFTAVPLSLVFKKAKMQLTPYKECVLSARDGVKITIPLSEILDGQATLAMVKDKKTNQEELTLIMWKDQFEQRWLKYVNDIALQ